LIPRKWLNNNKYLSNLIVRIALLTDGIWPYRIGGMQKHSYYLVKYFVRNGVDVDLYHLNQSAYDINKLEFFTEEEKKHIHSFIFPFPNYLRLPTHYISESEDHSQMMYEHFLKQEPVDFIYSKGYCGLYFIKQKQIELDVKGGSKIPPIGLRLHGYEIFQTGGGFTDWYRRLIYLPLVRYLNNCCDFIYSYGGGITTIIKNNFPHAENRIIEIPTGIEPEWVYEKNITCGKPLRFALLGRYEKRKGITELTGALKNLTGKQNFEFNFIGPIPDKHKINSPQIKYHGSIGDAEKIKEILRNTDVLILSSHSEGMPNVVMEAMASGCAVLATNVGAVNLMVSNDNGWLIEPRSAKSIEEKMLQILQTDVSEIEKKKINSVKKVKENFLWESVIKKEIEAIETIIKNKSA
jgi:glycosyltransferase involved in cell wall biosynthesis